MLYQFLLYSIVTQFYIYIYIYIYVYIHTHTYFFSYYFPSCSIPRDWIVPCAVQVDANY